LQYVTTEVTRLGAWTWEKGSLSNWGPCFCAICIWVFGLASVALAVIEIILSKMMLALFFSLAPLFIGFTLFKPTQGMFDRWLGAICGFALFLVMIPAVLALGLSFVQMVVGDQYATNAQNISLVDWIPIMIAGFLNLALILKVSEYSKSIGGSVSVGSGSMMFSSAVGGFVGGTFASISLAKSSGLAGKGIFSSIRSKTSSVASGAMNVLRDKMRGG